MYRLSMTCTASGVARTHRGRRLLAVSLFAVLAASPRVYAGDGPFVGVNLGVSRPTNNNYRAHVENGAAGMPYGGYMFNDYLGVQGQLQIVGQFADNDHRGFPNENQVTTMFGGTAGPRLSLPLSDNFEFYGTVQGGVFTGLSGRLKQTAPGLTAGGGLDYYLTHNIAVGLFGQWNRAFMAPHPSKLLNPDQVSDQQGPEDAQWATGGISVKYRFGGPAPVVAPPPPPPPPAKVAEAPPPPPVKKKLVLRSVNFDYNKSNIRRDAAPVLDEAVQTLKEAGTVAVIVAGHTDSIGGVEYNMKLSLRRAESVKEYLVKHGIPASRIRTEGFGKSKPVASNETDEGRAQNRRVELQVD